MSIEAQQNRIKVSQNLCSRNRRWWVFYKLSRTNECAQKNLATVTLQTWRSRQRISTVKTGGDDSYFCKLSRTSTVHRGPSSISAIKLWLELCHCGNASSIGLMFSIRITLQGMGTAIIAVSSRTQRNRVSSRTQRNYSISNSKGLKQSTELFSKQGEVQTQQSQCNVLVLSRTQCHSHWKFAVQESQQIQARGYKLCSRITWNLLHYFLKSYDYYWIPRTTEQNLPTPLKILYSDSPGVRNWRW